MFQKNLQKIEIEFRSIFDKQHYRKIKAFLHKNAKDLGKDDKDVYFFIMPDKLLKVVNNISKKNAEIILKLNKIGKGSDFEELGIPIRQSDVDKTVKLFSFLNITNNIMHSFQKRHNYRYKNIELALKYSDVWGYHLELEMVVDNKNKKEWAEKQIKKVADELGIKLMTDKELSDFTRKKEEEYQRDKGRSLYGSLEDIEVEMKVRINPSQIRTIRKKLFALGAVFKEKIKENDIYFTSFYRDFIKSKECLRIRGKDSHLELTHKGPTTKLMKNKKQFWKREINIPLSCSKEEIELFLKSLDFKKIVEVRKEREKYILGKQEISIDKVDNAGWFIEIENSVENPDERKKALQENIILLDKLDIDKTNIIEEPYRDLVLKNFS